MTTAPTTSDDSLQSIEQSELTLAPRTEPRDPTELKQVRRRRIAVAAMFMFGVTALVASLASFSGNPVSVDRSLVYFTVQPRDLAITVTERGTLESQRNVQIVCELDDVPGDAVYGTVILWMIENGSSVEKGDLVVEFDSASHVERLDQQILTTETAQFQFKRQTLHYASRLTNNEMVKANAELAVEMASLQLQQYEDDEGGTFQIAVQQVELGIQQREAWQQINDRNLAGTDRLHELGYRSKGDLAQARLQTIRSQGALQREAAERRKLVGYGYQRSKLQLEGALQSAERALVQVEANNKAKLAQNGIWLKMAEIGKKWHEGRLTHDRGQLEKCKVYAPQSGMVAYHVDSNRWGHSSTIAEGTAAYNRQPLMSIPDLSCMQVKTSVHETVIDRVKAGMRATVRIDAFPDRYYDGTIDWVAVLPDSGGWLNSGTKAYNAIVTIDVDVEQINPGMTAIVEIDIEQLHDVLCVPVQAIVHRGENTWCYVAKDGQVVNCPIETGEMNDKFVVISSGLSAGDRVVLNPSAILANDPDQEREIASDKGHSDEFSFD